MAILYEGLLVFSQPLRLLVALFRLYTVSPLRRSELLKAGDCQVGTNKLIANILVVLLSFFRPQIFDVPEPIFAKLCHTTSYGGGHTCP